MSSRVQELVEKYSPERLDEDAGGYSMNVNSLPLEDAREWASQKFRANGKSLDSVLPDFNQNYKWLQSKLDEALGVPRIQMPVIEPEQMDDFDRSLENGRIDLFKPFAKGKLKAPDSFDSRKEAERWVRLGTQDGHPNDDVVDGKWTTVAAAELLPTQDQIWFEKLINNIIKFGKPYSGSPVLKQTIIVSKDGYITDGHHRFGQVMLADPDLEMNALYIPMNIDKLLDISRSFGAYLGNDPKESRDRDGRVIGDRSRR